MNSVTNRYAICRWSHESLPHTPIATPVPTSYFFLVYIPSNVGFCQVVYISRCHVLTSSIYSPTLTFINTVHTENPVDHTTAKPHLHYIPTCCRMYYSCCAPIDTEHYKGVPNVTHPTSYLLIFPWQQIIYWGILNLQFYVIICGFYTKICIFYSVFCTTPTYAHPDLVICSILCCLCNASLVLFQIKSTLLLRSAYYFVSFSISFLIASSCSLINLSRSSCVMDLYLFIASMSKLSFSLYIILNTPHIFREPHTPLRSTLDSLLQIGKRKHNSLFFCRISHFVV